MNRESARNNINPYEKEITVAIEAVRNAAKLCTAVQSEMTPDTIQKKDKSPVTLADFGSQAIVCRILGDSFPTDPIVAEEASAVLRQPENGALLDRLTRHVESVVPGAASDEILTWIDRGGQAKFGERFWTLDPIDGTKGFIRGEQYAISLALIVEGTVKVAVLGCPNLSTGLSHSGDFGAVFAAIRGGGAVQLPQEKGAETEHRIEVSELTDITGTRFCESVEKAHSSHEGSAAVATHLEIEAQPVRLDSQAKYAWVARGDADAYLRLPRSSDYQEKIWDHAGGALIVEEAGGRVTDINGRPLDFGRGATLSKNRGVVASNGRVHDDILEAIRSLGIRRTPLTARQRRRHFS